MKNNDISQYIDSLLEKSTEAYLMALEVVNKPTIKYRTEGFCFFICNAWELLLKAWIIKENNNIDAIFFKKSNQTKRRSLSLHDCIKKYCTRDDDPLRVNISFITDIRNTATHDVISELDFQLAGFFQTCIENYTQILSKEFNISMNRNGVETFISIASLPELEIKSTLFYNSETEKVIESLLKEKTQKGIVEQNLTIVKSKNADITFRIANDGEIPIRIIKEAKDVNGLYPLTNKNVIDRIKTLLTSTYPTPHFTTDTFAKFCRVKKVKDNTEYCYMVISGKYKTYKYSEKICSFIATTLISDEKLYYSLLPKSKQKKEETPGEANSRQ